MSKGTGGAPLAGGSGSVRLPEPLNLIHTTKPSNPITTRVSAVLAMPMTAWQEGYRAGQIRANSNPYPVCSNDAWAWSSGYVEGVAYAAKS